MSTLTRMPTEVADELQVARTIAGQWANMQHFANLHLINTGRRDKYPGHEFRAMRIKGDAAIERIEQIKREYPSR